MARYYDPQRHGRGPLLLDKTECRGAGECMTRSFDVEHYNLTGEIKYIGEAEQVGRTVESTQKIAQMKAEITTVAAYREAGNATGLSKRYGLSKSAIKRWLTQLQNREGLQLQPDEGVAEKPETVIEATGELEELFKEKPEPDLSKLEMTPVISEYDPAILALEGNRFIGILGQMAELLQRKNENYGNSYHKLREKYGPVSFLIRISDKFNRLEQLILNGEPDKVGESIEETIQDIIGYSTLELDFRGGK